jgi:hypothetical protein
LEAAEVSQPAASTDSQLRWESVLD